MDARDSRSNSTFGRADARDSRSNSTLHRADARISRSGLAIFVTVVVIIRTKSSNYRSNSHFAFCGRTPLRSNSPVFDYLNSQVPCLPSKKLIEDDLDRPPPAVALIS